jgi:2-polyprenyl-3-methyl-5-hydroxy-6-metoxy-1,4-benzoquinol methylase
MSSTLSPIQYTTPLVVNDLGQCQFYHRMDIPGVGEVGGQWDLRACIREYLGNYDFNGKRALDVGTASGFLTFSMEKFGADVVSFEMTSGDKWDVVPQRHVRQDPERFSARLIEANRRLKNAYWFAHARLQSRAKAYYGDIYNVPEELGQFDVAVFGMIISHLRDAFRAIYSASRLVRDDLIIVNQIPDGVGAAAYFIPTTENKEAHCWWIFTQECVKQMLAVMGFEVVRIVKSQPRCLVPGREGFETCNAYVARRVEPVEP